jgi:hypothetical protein
MMLILFFNLAINLTQIVMDANLDEIAKLVTIAKPIIDPIISTLLKPSIDKLAKLLKRKEIDDKVIANFFEDKFSDYLSIMLNKSKNINLLIFQNQQIDIQDIYYPLTIFSYNVNEQYKIATFEKIIFEKYKKILISDNAGMGKSTLSKWLVKTAVETQSAIPILIDLRNLKENYGVLDDIFFQFNPIDQDFDKDLILKFIQLGKFLIIFDGFDEIQIKSQEIIIRNLREFINKAPDNWYLLTSRPEGALSAFGDFQQFAIKPLINDEPFELIKKYDSIAPIKISDELIRDIKEKYNQVSELLGNPFLVSLLYSTYTFNKDIPASKLSFYEEIYFALFKKHDLSKDGWTRTKKSGLDILQFRILLRQLAFDTALLGETSYSETELVNLVGNAIKSSPGLDTNPDLFVEDLILTVPIFQREGLKIKWAHKSIQDFFAAEFIGYDSKKEQFLNIIYDSNIEKFNNVLEFVFESDYKTFRKVIIKKLLDDFVKHYNTSYNATEFITHKSLELRKFKTFGVKYFFKKDFDADSFADLFTKVDSEYPDVKSYKNRGIYVGGHGFEILTISGLQVAIIDMLLGKSDIFTIKASDHEAFKIKLNQTELLCLNDSPNNILNSKSNFDKVTKALPNTGNKINSYNETIIINYQNAKKEIEKINLDIQSDALSYTFSNLFKQDA